MYLRYILSMYFRYFVMISPLKKVGLFIWTKLESPYYDNTRIICAMFGWNCTSDSGDDENEKKTLQTDGRTTDNWRSEKLTWVYSSDELKNLIIHTCRALIINILRGLRVIRYMYSVIQKTNWVILTYIFL